MSPHFKSRLISIVLAGLACLLSGTAGAVKVCIDPGHGGRAGDPAPVGYNFGAPGINCDEKDMNLTVGIAAWYLMNNNWSNYSAELTRVTDTVVPLADRVADADRIFATVFISCHHNGVATNTVAHHTTYGLYCDQGNQASYWWGASQFFAREVAGSIHDYFGASRGLDVYGAIEDFALNGTIHTYIRLNERPAMLGEPCGTLHPAANLTCPNQHSNAAYQQAQGYFNGVVLFTGITSVGVSFTASPMGVGGVRLSWQENDPSRIVTYVIYRSDKCWGPWEYVASIESQDPQYTADNTHYAYGTGAPYNRLYWYRLAVMGEAPEASVTPFALSQPIPVGPPGDLTAQGTYGSGGVGTVVLNWSPSSGTADGYHVYRSRYVDMPNCNARYEYLGTATGTAFADTTAPAGVQLFYRVRGYNATDGSDVSAEASVTIDQTVSVGPDRRVVRSELGWLGPNPTRGGATLEYAIASRGEVRLTIYDVAGRSIAEPLRGAQEAGVHVVVWDGTGRGGERVSPGVYFFRLSVDETQVGRKGLVLVR